MEYLVGNYYERMDGSLVKIVGATEHCVYDKDDCHYYNRSGDRGRVTGTAHDYSYPRNLVRLYTHPTTERRVPEDENLRMALENCRLLAARHRKEDWALLILGFCAEGGVVGSVMR